MTGRADAPDLPWVEGEDGCLVVYLDGEDEADPGDRFVLIVLPGSSHQRADAGNADLDSYYWELATECGSRGYVAGTLDEAKGAAAAEVRKQRYRPADAAG